MVATGADVQTWGLACRAGDVFQPATFTAHHVVVVVVMVDLEESLTAAHVDPTHDAGIREGVQHIVNSLF